jgi:hypothetical protein
MPDVAALNTSTSLVGAAAGSSSQMQSQADAMIQEASSGGHGLDTAKLGAEVAKLPASQQPSAMSALGSRLTPLQQGQVLHYAAKADSESALPAQYQRGADGKLQLSSQYAKQACSNYNKMMTSNQQVGNIVNYPVGGASLASIGSHTLQNALGSIVGKTVGTISGIAALTTQTLGNAPAPPGCNGN